MCYVSVFLLEWKIQSVLLVLVSGDKSRVGELCNTKAEGVLLR